MVTTSIQTVYISIFWYGS